MRHLKKNFAKDISQNSLKTQDTRTYALDRFLRMSLNDFLSALSRSPPNVQMRQNK